MTPHQAPAAGAQPAADLEAAVVGLDAQLQALADQLGQVEGARAALQAQYDETAALLQQAAAAHDQATGGTA